MTPKFLLIDDDKDVLVVAEAIFMSLGCEVQSAGGGTEALEFLSSVERAKTIDAIFLDVMMPDINGYEVLKIIKEREHTKNIPVIMLTARDRGNDIIEGYQHGADYYIPKPFNREQLVYGVDLVLGDESTDTTKTEKE
jgi:two-component system, chemotaxis family, chemotaxis protein CheY